jgi:hypothetical protein
MAQKHSGYEEVLSAMKQIGSTKTVKRICMLLMDIVKKKNSFFRNAKELAFSLISSNKA